MSERWGCYYQVAAILGALVMCVGIVYLFGLPWWVLLILLPLTIPFVRMDKE